MKWVYGKRGVMGGRGEIREEGEMGLWKEKYTRGNLIFTGIGLGCLPRGFLF